MSAKYGLLPTLISYFGHADIINYCGRPFSSTKEMDTELIIRWNETVSPDDSVYHLGDFTLGGIDVFLRYIKQLNGNIYIVPGGHDRRWIRKFNSAKTRTGDSFLFPPLYTLRSVNPPIVLCHYAMRVWDRSHYGSYHLYGHSHGNLPEQVKSLDVGVDVHDFTPISLYQIHELLKEEDK